MKPLRNLWFSVRALVVRDRASIEIDEELAYHLERETRMNEQAGMSPAEARREAVRKFGGVQRYREECRDVQHVSWLDDLRTDVRFTFRLARHNPGFTTSVVCISALGIAACVTTFSLVSGILLAPLSFPGQDRVFNLYLQSSEGESAAIPTATYLRIANAPVFDGVTATEPRGMTIMGNGETARVRAGAVTPSFFRVYRVRLVAGRPFTEDDVASRAQVVLLSYEEWQHRYAGDPAAIGKSVSLDGKPHTIIGVMPRKFLGNFESSRFPPTLWLPLAVDRGSDVNLTLRVADSVPVERASAWLRTMVRNKVGSYKTTDSLTATPTIVPLTEMVYGDVQRPLMILLGSVILVLILVAANIATMFLARSSARAGEFGVRTALGASAGRQFRQLITESITLTAIGGVIGIGVSVMSISAIRTLGQKVLPRIDNVAIDWRVLLFAAGGVVMTGCAGGIAHAMASRRKSPSLVSRGPRVTTRSTSTALVVVQLALSVMLLSGAGLLVKSFVRVAPTNPGFTLRNRASLTLTLYDRADTSSDELRGRRLATEIATRMRGVAGVEDVALTSFVPLSGLVSIVEIQPVGVLPGSKRLTASSNLVSSNFFGVMQIPIKRGRGVSSTDGEGAEPVAVINETAASRWWPGEDPIGKQVAVERGKKKHTVTIVGVVGGTRMSGRNTRPVAELYEAAAQSPIGWVTFIVATTTDPRRTLPALQRAVHDVVPRLPITESSDLATIASESVRIGRFYSVAMSFFATAAVLLSALGIYGLLSFAVAQRRREIGIRMALGATTSRIGRSVIGRAVIIAVTGVVIGGVLARALSRYMESLLTEVKTTDPAVFGLAIVAVLVFAILAACAPTYQAVRIDPIKSLRT